MFKFRRPSICADLEIVSDTDSVAEVTDEIQKGISINSTSESRSAITREEADAWKESGNGDCETQLGETSNFYDMEEHGLRKFKRNNYTSGTKSATTSSLGSPSSMISANSSSSSDFFRQDPFSVTATDSRHMISTSGRTNYPATTNTSACCSVTMTNPVSSTSGTTTVYDRKRKERHESCSRGQEKKVIRSLSHEDQKVAAEVEKENTFRSSHNNDNFQNNINGSQQVQAEDTHDQSLVDQAQVQSSDPNGKQINSKGVSELKQNPQLHNSSGPIDSSSYGVGTTPVPQYGIVRNMPLHFEAEVQRQWERSAQWTAGGGTRKSHGSKHRRYEKASSLTQSKNSFDRELDDVRDAVDVIPFNEDELHSPTSEESSSSSVDSLEFIENQEKLSPNLFSEDDIGDDLPDSSNLAVTTDSSNRTNGSGLKRLLDLDFSTLHHQVETNEPIPFLAALQASGMEDQVLLSPRNSVLIKEASDPNVPPSPPLHQVILDPPICRQHGGNQSMEINTLSKQVNTLKKHLKSLEQEYEQLFGYKPSHADKLNQKEMRKALLQLTKAKKELKQLKEDPASVRTGPGLLQVTGLPLAMFSRNSLESLRSLDETVKEINKTLVDKRRSQSRPEDPALMSLSELTEEKNAMQKQLLMLEKKHGRPGSKEEKEIVRSLYDRYRFLKKTGIRLGGIKESSIDLAPIMEHETLEFTQSNELNNTSTTKFPKDGVDRVGNSNSKESRLCVGQMDQDQVDAIINISNEGLTDMSLSDLETRQRLAQDEKRKLRVILRKFESDFQNATGRPPQKDEKYSSAEMETTYQKYKCCRATVRLLDVLITKRKYPQLLEVNKNED